jgi:hypothetical protein
VGNKIVESNLDNFVFEKAFVVATPGGPAPRALVGGVLCNIETKSGVLADGLAWCEPVDRTRAESWPVYTDLVIDGVSRRMWNVTDERGVVKAARRFAELDAAGRAEPGMDLSKE